MSRISSSTGVSVIASNIPADHAPDAPGEWAIHRTDETGNVQIRFGCPLRHGQSCGVNIKPHSSDAKGVPSWTWDGDVESPTLTPSINCINDVPNSYGCGWHGFLTKGRMVIA